MVMSQDKDQKITSSSNEAELIQILNAISLVSKNLAKDIQRKAFEVQDKTHEVN